MIGLLVTIALFLGAQGQSDGEIDLDAASYPKESYNVTTKDGYVLGVYRMPYGKNASISNGKVAFLMHSAPYAHNCFTYAGSKNAIAYNLADAGYDVWMGNSRGNSYSRRHVSLDPDLNNTQFYDFTLEDIALSDLPAMIDFVLNKTKKDKLYYIGHSLGGTAFLILNSMNTSYQSKFAYAHLLSGIGYESNVPNTDIVELSSATDIIYDVLRFTGNLEMKPINLTLLFLQTLVNSTVPSAFLDETSVRVFAQLGQNIRDKAFRRWNYGPDLNSQIYGNTQSPWYDIGIIPVRVIFHYSDSDTTQSETDVLAMVKAMPNANARKVSKSSFKNLDYLISNNVKTLVTDFIIQSFDNN